MKITYKEGNMSNYDNSGKIGMNAIGRARRVEQNAAEMGFRFVHPKFGNHRERDEIGLAPLGESFPIYSRDAELFTGTLQDVEVFLLGMVWTKRYYEQLKLIDDTKISRKEQDYRNRILVNIIKDSGENNGSS